MSDRSGARGGAAEVDVEERSILEEASEKVREKSADLIEKGQAKVASVAHSAADKLESAAQYVSDRHPKEMLADLRAVFRAHPGKSLLAVMAVGFLAGRALRRD